MGSTKRDIPLQGAEASSSNGNFSSSLVRPVHRQDNGASATTDTGRGRLYHLVFFLRFLFALLKAPIANKYL